MDINPNWDNSFNLESLTPSLFPDIQDQYMECVNYIRSLNLAFDSSEYNSVGFVPEYLFGLKDAFDRVIEYFEIHKNILPVDQFARFKLNRDHLIQSINRTE